MGLTVTPLVVPVPAEWDRALAPARIPELVGVLQEAGFVQPTGPCQAFLTGPAGRRESIEGDLDRVLAGLRAAWQPDDSLYLSVPGSADPPPACYEIERVGAVLPRFVQGVSLDLSRFLVVKLDPDGSLPCPECQEELPLSLVELLPPDWETLDEHLGLLARFWLSFLLANKARPAEPKVAPELMSRLAAAAGCELRTWYEGW